MKVRRLILGVVALAAMVAGCKPIPNDPGSSTEPSTRDVADLLSGFCSFKDTVAGAVFEEWAQQDEWAIGAPDGSISLQFYVTPQTMEQKQTFTHYVMGGTPYTSDGVLVFDMSTVPATLTGELTLHGGTIARLGFDLAIGLDMQNPSATTISGTVIVDGWSYDVADFGAFKQKWLELFAGEMAVYTAAQAAIDIGGTWAGTVDLGGSMADAVMTFNGGSHTFESLLYDVGTSDLREYSSRGTFEYTYSRYAAGEPATGTVKSSVTEMYNGSIWGAYDMQYTSKWEKTGDVLALQMDMDSDGTFDLNWTLNRQP